MTRHIAIPARPTVHTPAFVALMRLAMWCAR